MSIIWSDKDIHGSPFRIHVLPNPKNDHPASQIICTGDALRMGIVGKEMKCLIDTRSVGAGELTVYCQGPSKTALCRLDDHRNGTCTLFIKPEESGKHLLTIQYNGEDIPGSPYTIQVNNKPDSSEYNIIRYE